MNPSYTRESWRSAYAELLQTLEEAGVPGEVGRYIAQNLKTERCLRRMTGYVRQAHPSTMEEIADEMFAIMEDRNRWTQKRETLESNARYNAWLNSDRRGADD